MMISEAWRDCIRSEQVIDKVLSVSHRLILNNDFWACGNVNAHIPLSGPWKNVCLNIECCAV